MDAERYRQVESLFHAALSRRADERAVFLDDACADAPDVRAAVERLLQADADEGGEVLDAPPLPLPSDEPVDRQVGPYRVLRPLGSGGMGEVVLAVRDEPFRRYVALKLIRGGGQNPQARARFALERQVLASLDHPGIARLYDGGVTDPSPDAPEGQPYLAMEYVDGQPITAYADERRLSVDARLRLFEAVCGAVHTAHQSLVLHRDLKPSNILVTSGGDVKLLDFGIAKLLAPDLSAVPVPETRTEARLLTPEYASPEQVRGEPLTTASDVYSLGVLLYELLTGHRPHRLAGRTMEDVIRTVSEEPPTRPSAVATSPPASPREADAPVEERPARSDADRRGLTPERLARRLTGDLDAICLRALRKEPSRRYGSAELMAQDVGRHLAQRPVLARRGTRRYRLGSFLRRHRVEAAAALAVLASLVGGLGAALWQAGEAGHERDLARTEAAKAEEVASFLVDLLQQADPTAAVGDTLTVREVLGDGVARIDALAGQPTVQASLLTVIAEAYQSLGRPDEARPLVERALAIREAALGDHPDTAESRYALALIYLNGQANGDLGEANVGEAVRLLRLAVGDAQRHHGAVSPEVLVALNALATALHMDGQPEEAERVRERWRDLLDRGGDVDHPLVAVSLADYAQVLIIRRQEAEAERYLRRALAMSRRVDGDTSQAVGLQLRHLAHVTSVQGRHDEAVALARESLAINRLLHPEGHKEVAHSYSQLGQVLLRRGRYGEAEGALRSSLEVTQRLYPDGHLAVGRAFYHLAVLEHARGRFGEAEGWQRQALAAFEASEGPSSLVTVRARVILAGFLTDLERYAEAEPLLVQALDHARATGATMLLNEDDLRGRLVALYEGWGRPRDAARYRVTVSPELPERPGAAHGR